MGTQWVYKGIQGYTWVYYGKKKAEKTKDQSCWDDFKTARNEVNN